MAAAPRTELPESLKNPYVVLNINTQIVSTDDAITLFAVSQLKGIHSWVCLRQPERLPKQVLAKRTHCGNSIG
jgi:hypothetical protein